MNNNLDDRFEVNSKAFARTDVVMQEQMPRLREVKCVAILRHRDGHVEIREL